MRLRGALRQAGSQGLEILAHEAVGGGAALQVLAGDVVAAVEEGGPRPGGLGDAVRHQVVGELDVEDRGDALALHLLRQEGHGGGGGLQ